MSASAGGDWAGMLRSYLTRWVKPITTSTISIHVVGVDHQNAPNVHPGLLTLSVQRARPESTTSEPPSRRYRRPWRRIL